MQNTIYALIPFPFSWFSDEQASIFLIEEPTVTV